MKITYNNPSLPEQKSLILTVLDEL